MVPFGLLTGDAVTRRSRHITQTLTEILKYQAGQHPCHALPITAMTRSKESSGNGNVSVCPGSSCNDKLLSDAHLRGLEHPPFGVEAFVIQGNCMTTGPPLDIPRHHGAS
jgi:hypothetical protein